MRHGAWFAIGATVISLIAATAGHAPPWMAVAADTGDTVLVTLNGLRLLRPRAPRTPR